MFVHPMTGRCRLANCNQWACPSCGPRKARRFVARILRGEYNWFWTFTTGEQLTPESSSLLSARIRRFIYFVRQQICDISARTWTKETGEHGRRVLHAHMLVGASKRRISYKELHRLADRCGLAPMRKWKRIRGSGGRVAGYVAKYLGKAMTASWPRYVRRCWTSVPELPWTRESGWQFKRIRAALVAAWDATPEGAEAAWRRAYIDDRRSALPCSGSLSEPASECGRTVADAEPGSAELLLPPNCSGSGAPAPILDSERNSVTKARSRVK